MSASTVNEIAEGVGLDPTLLDQEFLDSFENRCAFGKLIPNWYEYAGALHLSTQEINGIQSNVLLDFPMKTRELLKKWKSKNGFKATYRKLIEAWLPVGNEDAAKAMCQAVSKLYSTAKPNEQDASMKKDTGAKNVAALKEENNELIEELNEKAEDVEALKHKVTFLEETISDLERKGVEHEKQAAITEQKAANEYLKGKLEGQKDGAKQFAENTARAQGKIPDPTKVIFAAKYWKLDGFHAQKDAGRGVLIAVLDTGVNPNHVALQGKVVKYGRNFVTEDKDPTKFSDTDPKCHGTAVAGVIAGKHLISKNYPELKEILNYTGFEDKLPLGVASQATLVICRVATSDPSPSYVAEALKWIWEHNYVVMGSGAPANLEVAHKKDCGLNHEAREENIIRIISMSFRLADNNSDIESYINDLNAQGVICVAGAGNNGNNQDPGWPAKYHNVLSVGSVNGSGVASDFSTRDPTLIDVYAPGEVILVPKNTQPSSSGKQTGSSNSGASIGDSSPPPPPPGPPPPVHQPKPQTGPQQPTDKRLEHASGTSFATPAVSGLIAILLQLAREQGGPALAKKISNLTVLKKLFKKHMLHELDTPKGAWLLRPQKMEEFFSTEVDDLKKIDPQKVDLEKVVREL